MLFFLSLHDMATLIAENTINKKAADKKGRIETT